MGFGYNFRRLTSREALIEALGIDALLFQRVLDFVPPPPTWEKPPEPETPIVILDAPAFIRHDIPKKNRSRGYRTVWEPLLTKSVYKALARRLDNFFRFALKGYPHDCAFGYRAGRNIRENAFAHTGHRFLLSVDLKDFFPSISREAVFDMFRSVGVIEEVSDSLARFVTIAGALPLGLPTSPTISNAIAVPIDEALSRLAASTGSVYTRYSDDMSFSGNAALPDLSSIADVLAGFGFDIAKSKTRRSTVGQSHYVTGLSISDPVRPHVPKGKKRKLRQELYFANKFGLSEHLRHCGINDEDVVQQEVNRLDGMVKFTAHHEPRMSAGIKEQWRSILQDSGMKPSFAPRGLHHAPFFLFIDEAEYSRDGRKILALCIVVTQHIQKVVDETNQVLIRAINDLWMDGDVETLRTRGLHFTDATQDVRLAYVKELARMPFEAYVAYREYGGPDAYEEAYLSLLSAMITRRLMAAESQYAHVYFEQNSKVSTSKIKFCVESAMTELKASNNRRPAGASVEFIGKPNPALSPPDFLLGVLGQYLISKPVVPGRPEPRERLMFERVRDKYRLILDVPTRTEYSRRRPIVPWSEAEEGSYKTSE
ncbi:RNA-directed DNA polymerase [Sinorhizobium medicae]|nr:RNA-directed DNA polymerase [Sinorhizobium medicae]MDX1006560.1 RNA-directed DNA polymerase [Sinorhizobium medicae]